MAACAQRSPPTRLGADRARGARPHGRRKSRAAGATPRPRQRRAQDFEAVFLNSMFSQMFTGIDGEGPFGGGQATGVWRSFLTDEYSKSFAKAGGIGIAKRRLQRAAGAAGGASEMSNR